MESWRVIIPVKPAAAAKSRLTGGEPTLARAIALDTITAARSATRVSGLVIVTADTALAAEFEGADDVLVVLESAPTGIAAAIGAATATIPITEPRAVLLGDLPSLRPQDLDVALDLAAAHRAAFVPDREGTGSTLVTAAAGVELIARFGEGSAAAHGDAGLVALEVPPESSVRRDVDDTVQLAEAVHLGVGPRTAAVLGTIRAGHH